MSSSTDQTAPSHAAIIGDYRALTLRRALVVAGLALVCLLLFCLDMGTGQFSMSLTDVLRALFAPDTLTDPRQATIVRGLRLPQATLAVLVGAALALAGAEMQTILNNPLASPFTLGVSAAAAFGASLAIVLGFSVIPFIGGGWLVAANAFVFALGSMLLLQALSRLRGGGAESMVLFGIALVFAFNALTSLMQYVSSQETLQQLVFWTMGSLTRELTWDKIGVLAFVVAVVTPLSLLSSNSLTALRLGEDRARSFGIDVSRLRLFSLIRVSLLAATAVSIAGSIGFIGLVGPHIARMLVGEDHKVFLPASILSGAAIMSLASAASKSLIPGANMPVGIVTALVGVPVFLLLIFRAGSRA